MFEDTKWVTRSHKYNGQQKKDKRKNNNVHNTTQKTKY